MKLQLIIYKKSGGKANIIFKSTDTEFRIDGMLNRLRLVAELEQLRLAINANGGKASWFELEDSKGMFWMLECRCLNGIVGLDLWRQGDDEGAFTDFSWNGSTREFDKAIRYLTTSCEEAEH